MPDSSKNTMPLVTSHYRSDANGLYESSTLGQFKNMRKRGYIFNFIWLVYSVFFFIVPIQQNNVRSWVEIGIAYPLFVAIYIAIYHVRSVRQQYWLLAAMAALGFAYMPFNPGAGGMIIYVAALLPFIAESTTLCFVVIGFLCIGLTVEAWLLHMSPWNWGFTAFFCVAVGAGNCIAAQVRRSGIQLMRAHEQMAELAKVAERERIARDLHDLLGHTLSVVALKAELAGRFFDRDPARARIEIGEVETVARQALQQVREAVSGYRMRGLAAEIDNAQRSLAAAGVKLTCVTPQPELGPTEESVLALILREAVTNVLRHAQATEVRLEFSGGPENVQLAVVDNGRGGIRAEGSGLRGMRERVQMLGGHFRLDSAQGTAIFVQLPAHATTGTPLTL